MRKILLPLSAILFLVSCSPAKFIGRSAQEHVLQDTSLRAAHVGISIYEPATGKYLYNYQADKYFVPASNTKIPTCYAAMKYLGDSLVGAYISENDTAVYVYASADPTFLSTSFSVHPLFKYLKQTHKHIYLNPSLIEFKAYGGGWSWNDYESAFMPSRSSFPMYDGLVRFKKINGKLIVTPSYFNNVHLLFSHQTNGFSIKREFGENVFGIVDNPDTTKLSAEVPFRSSAWYGVAIGLEKNLLSDTLKNKHIYADYSAQRKDIRKFHSHPTDSLLKPMMHRSDNFFAEQSLLMVSNEVLGVMNDAKIIDTILKTDFKDLPQKPRWSDGSGLSRYNLFTPQDFIAILNKMKNEFGMERIKDIFPTGNEGTLTNYYKSIAGQIFAKTGTLSGVVALSGFLYTKENKLFLFSVLVNNHQASAAAVRRAIEKFIVAVRERY